MPSYSFLDTQMAIAGPNGSVNVGPGSGVTEGGVSIAFVEEKNTMQIGADGEGQHSLHAGRASTVTIRLQKVSPVNAVLQAMYDLDTAGGRQHGQNTFSFRDLVRGDSGTGEEVAFAKFPDVSYAKEAGEMVWTFQVVKTYIKFGSGISAQAA